MVKIKLKMKSCDEKFQLFYLSLKGMGGKWRGPMPRSLDKVDE